MTNILLSTAIADALGVPFESKPADNPLLSSWNNKSFLGSEYHKLKPGQFSDDTVFSITIAKSLIECNGFNPDDLSKRYIDLIDSGQSRGYGRTTLLAIENLKAGKYWSESGVPGSYGNGTAMRAAPFGVFFRNNLSALIDAVKIDSAITHRSDEAEAGALTVALATYFIVNDEEDNLLAQINPYLPNSVVKDQLRKVADFINTGVSPITALTILGTRADVRQTVPAALYCYLKFKNYPDAIVAAIRAGWDADTTAAITGALCGAKYGIKGIPTEWVDQVEDRDKLIILDNQLFSKDNSNILFA